MKIKEIRKRGSREIRKVEWKPEGMIKKNVYWYSLVDSEIYHKYKNDKNNPDYVNGLEYEPFVLYIFSSGFENLYHVVMENGEGGDNQYWCMTKEEIKEKHNIEL